MSLASGVAVRRARWPVKPFGGVVPWLAVLWLGVGLPGGAEVANAANAAGPSETAVAATPLDSVEPPDLALPALWEAALRHDPVMQAAQAAQRAGENRGEQARALWRPDVLVSGGAGYVSASSSMRDASFSAPAFGSADRVRFGTDIDHGRGGQWHVALTQPLYSPQLDAQQRLLEIAAEGAALQGQATRQERMLQLAETYFALALAEQSLRVLQRQQQSVERILVETRDRFTFGDLPVTDTYEAQARAESVRAQVLAAEAALALHRSALTDLSGYALPPDTARLPGALRDDAVPLPPLDDWLTWVARDNLELSWMARQVAAAEAEAGRHGDWHAVRVDLVAKAGGEHVGGDGPAAQAANHSRQTWAGVQFSLPLSTSGLRAAQRREAANLLDQARAERDQVAQRVARQTRDAWLGLTTGAARVRALQAGATASLARLEATRLGVEAGDRTTRDVLDAENDHAAASLALEEARVKWLLDRLRIDALAGRLDEAALQWSWRQTRPVAAERAG